MTPPIADLPGHVIPINNHYEVVVAAVMDISKWPTQPLIDDGQATIASLRRDAGYATAMVGK